MKIWFIRCNGETAHNQPGASRYVYGEPPKFPKRKFNYVDECLHKGFARVGFPGTGNLRDENWRSRANDVYGPQIKFHHVGYLEQFSSIIIGDIVLLPTYRKHYEVHLGIVISPRQETKYDQIGLAYYYYYDISKGDWYDNAHRVNVQWLQDSNRSFSSFDVPEIGGTWRRSFGQVKNGSQRIIQLAKNI